MGLRVQNFLFVDTEDCFVYFMPAISALMIYMGVKMTVAIVASIRKDRKH